MRNDRGMDCVPSTCCGEPKIDLLSLISRAIDELRSAVERFEDAERDSALRHLSAAVQEIDAYLETVDADTLLRLAPLAPATIREGLESIRDDLMAVIESVVTSKPSEGSGEALR